MWYSGWDGGSVQAGRWALDVLTIDPHGFAGRLGATYGPDLVKRETVAELAAFTGAKAAMNAGFFVMDPAAGAEGDPAGVGVYDGKLESETVAGRPALVLHDDARRTEVVRPTWSGTWSSRGTTLTLDGLNRVPGLIRNCGGDASDQPTALPVHDFTCTDASELVAFDEHWAASTPAGPGREVVLDAQGRVVSVLQQRGTHLAAGQHSIQATGTYVARLDGVRAGQPTQLRMEAYAGHKPLALPRTTVINGGPQLLQGGAPHITQATDGMRQAATNPSFDYGWVLQRNPRTFAGTDAQGRTLVVTADGRQLDALGLSIKETAEVAQALGMREAINLDGGGSTTAVVNGQVVNKPSDAAGQRPVGDAIVIR